MCVCVCVCVYILVTNERIFHVQITICNPQYIQWMRVYSENQNAV